MKEHPILFSAPMVRALLDGTKTQTRRVVKLPQMIEEPGDPDATQVAWLSPSNAEPGWYGWMTEYPDEGGAHIRCPYGVPGDRLWVREAWGQYNAAPPGIVYRADEHLPCGAPERWRPSIHMPRGFSRITLEISAVRVERLQGISEADAQAEGCSIECMTPTGDDNGSAIHGPGGYIALWESINGEGSWALNPWVWVVSFRRLEENNGST